MQHIRHDRLTSVAAGRVLSSCAVAKHAVRLPYSRLWEICYKAEQERAVNKFIIGQQRVSPSLRTSLRYYYYWYYSSIGIAVHTAIPTKSYITLISSGVSRTAPRYRRTERQSSKVRVVTAEVRGRRCDRAAAGECVGSEHNSDSTTFIAL